MTTTETGLEVTLLDLGCMDLIGERPYDYANDMSVESLERMCMESCHLAPELSCGGKASSATDVYSFGRFIKICDIDNNTLWDLATKAMDRDPEKRPSL